MLIHGVRANPETDFDRAMRHNSDVKIDYTIGTMAAMDEHEQHCAVQPTTNSFVSYVLLIAESTLINYL